MAGAMVQWQEWWSCGRSGGPVAGVAVLWLKPWSHAESCVAPVPQAALQPSCLALGEHNEQKSGHQMCMCQMF